MVIWELFQLEHFELFARLYKIKLNGVRRRMVEQSLETLMRQYGNDVLRLAYLYVKEYHLAEDIFQDVFLKVNQNIANFRGESTIKTWILRITVNTCKDYLKSAYYNRVQMLNEEQEQTLAAEDSYETIEKRQDLRYVRDILEQMPKKYKEVLWLLYFEEKTLKETACILGIREGTVKSRAFRAKEKLKQELWRFGKEDFLENK